MISLLLREPR